MSRKIVGVTVGTAISPEKLKEKLGLNSGGNADLTAAAIDYDQNVRAVNHRGFNTVAPENTIPAYILSKKNGFKYVECDVSFTSDGVCVLLHDSTIDRTSNGSGTISAMTYTEAAQYDYGSWKSSAYAGTHLPTLDEFLMTCKGLGLHPYIEIKTSGMTQANVESIVSSVKAAGMKGKVTYISYNATYLGYVKTVDPFARLGYVVTTVTSTVVSTATGLKLDTNEVFIDTDQSKLTEAMVKLCSDADIPLEVWTANSASWIESMNPYISGVTSDSLIAGKVLYDKYIQYDAPDVPDVPDEPEIPATGITLSASALTFDSTASKTLTATVTPSNTTDSVIWSSSANGVVSVNNGVVTPVANGTATITAKAGSVSAQCSVTVEFAVVVETYTVTNALTNVSNSNSATKVNEGTAYTATLTAADGYELDSVTVTMGGEDITTTAYSGGVVSISSVKGNIAITAIAVVKAIEAPAVPEGYELVRNLYASDFAIIGLHYASPYTLANNKRLSYTKFDIPVESGYVYRYDFVSDDNAVQIGLQHYNESALGYIETSGNIKKEIYDPGWQENGTIINIPERHNNSPIAGVRLTFQKTNGTIAADTIKAVTISRKSSAEYTVTNNLTNVTSDNTISKIVEATAYTAKLSSEAGFSIGSGQISVVMGGVDITAEAYSNGDIAIDKVTGDIVITAVANTAEYETVKTLTSADLQYGVGLDSASPYYKAMESRVSYTAFDIPVEPGYKYKFDIVSDSNTVQIGAQFYNTHAPTIAANSSRRISVFDPGWKTSGVEIRVQNEFADWGSFNVYPIGGVRLTFRADTANSAVTDGLIQSVTISRIPV